MLNTFGGYLETLDCRVNPDNDNGKNNRFKLLLESIVIGHSSAGWNPELQNNNIRQLFSDNLK